MTVDLSRILRYTGLGLLLAVLAVGPFLQGLFFWTELLAAIAVVSFGFLLWLIGRRMGDLPLGLPGGAAGWGLLALLACYLVQFAWAVYPRGNLDWVLRVAAAWMAYVMVRQEAGPGLRRWLGWLFVLSAVIVGMVGFGEYSGYLFQNPEIAKALTVVGLQSRMFTVFQYPNTAAVYFLTAMFAALGLGLEERKLPHMALTGAVMSFLSLAFFFTISRGAVLIFPFGLAFLMLGLPRGTRWPILLYWLLSLGLLAVAMRPVGTLIAEQSYSAVFTWLTVIAALGGAGGATICVFLRLKGRLQGGAMAAAIAIAAASFLVLRPPGSILPEQASRLLVINLRTVNVVARLTFSADALKIVADHPLGLGGAGWSRAYRQYQQTNYVANETHNHYAQTAVEAGWLGLLALVAALGAALWAGWRNQSDSPLPWALASGAGLLAGHSLIDFNLSFGLVWLLLWALLAATAKPAPGWRYERTSFPVGAGVGLAVAVLAAVLAIGSHRTGAALALVQAGQAEEARVLAEAATQLDPWDSRPLLSLDDQASLERAAKLDRSNAGAHWQLSIKRELEGDFTGALAAARSARELQPLTSLYWTKEAGLAGKLLVDALHNGKLEEARRLGTELVELGKALEERRTMAEAAAKVLPGPVVEMSPEFRLRYGQGLYLAGQTSEAEAHLVEAAKQGLLGSEAEVWLYALYERRGDKAGIDRLANKPWVRFRGVNPVYKAVRGW